MDLSQGYKASIRSFTIFSLLIILPVFSTITAQVTSISDKEIVHAIYISANTGLSPKTAVLESIALASQNDPTASLVLAGNITTEKGYPKNEIERSSAQEFLRKDLLSPLKNFKGNIIFTPGVNEWKADAPNSIEDLESFLQDNTESEFWPDDGCPLERESVGEDLMIISVDSQWFLENWDDHSEMNNKCDLNTREKFFTEFKDNLKDSQGKTILVAIHHPVLTNTKTPFIQRIIGVSAQSFQNKEYQELRSRLETLASQFEDVIFISGNDRNLQYLYNGRNPQIISGTAASTFPAHPKKNGKFASELPGYAKLSLFKDGSSAIQFFSIDDLENPLFSEEIPRERPRLQEIEFPDSPKVSKTALASIYSSEETQKSEFYKWLWGKRYRNIYSTKISAPVLILDSLPGNIKPISEGRDQQSKSLRLINDSKNEYTLRALRKDPIQYLQADLVKSSYIEEFATNTVAERYVSDFFTTAHPYAPFAVNDLSTAANILHASPEIFYVPKQRRLGVFNDDYGGALYMLEEHVGEENREFEMFGSPDNILSTADLLQELKKSKDSYVDQDAYIRARLFDMLIGDWDRHQDQWRWAQFRENGKTRYEPIPRDRDHAFSKYDGSLMPVLKMGVPLLRKMQSYDEELENLKWFNWSGYPLDLQFITTAKWEDWEKQVKFLQEHLTDDKLEIAFESLPKEIKGGDIEDIKYFFKKRRENLDEFAREYFSYFQEFQVVKGTKENDRFLISRNDNGITEIRIFHKDREIFSNTYTSEETDEIWIYGLDGEDSFEVTGKGEDLIKLKILGGEEKDTYDFANTHKVKLYDFKSAESIIKNPNSKKWLVDSYDINHYNYLKRKYAVNQLLPSVNYVSDAGFTAGFKDIYTTYGISTNPFTTQYSFAANYFFASNGFDLQVTAEFANIFHNWNFRLETRYSTPNYFTNYFGSGNNTIYDKNEVDRNYNKVKLQQWEFSPSVIWRGEAGASLQFSTLLESLKVRYEEDSYLGENFLPENDIFEHQIYAGTEVKFHYLNKNNLSFPTLGSELKFTSGYKQNIDDHNNSLAYIRPSLSIDYPLISTGYAAIATKIGGEVIFGENYEFYHGASIGGNDNLRGYRNHRFNGKQSFYHSTELRSALGIIRTNFIPLVIGVTAGFDYGRVWTPGEDSGKWHNDYGGSVWINAALALAVNVGYYHGGDGNRIAFTLNFKY